MQHALFVVDDDFWCTQVEQATQTVVAVDHSAVQVVQVGSCKTSTVQLHHWAQVWRNNWNDVKHHCFWIVDQAAGIVATVERSDDLEALDGFLLALSAQHFAVVAVDDRIAQQYFFCFEVDGVDQRLDRLCTGATNEILAVAIFDFAPQLFVFDDHAGVHLAEGVECALCQVDFTCVTIGDRLQVFVDQLLTNTNVGFFSTRLLELFKFGFSIFLTLLDFFFTVLDQLIAVFKRFFFKFWKLSVALVDVDARYQPGCEVNNLLELLCLDFLAWLEAAQEVCKP